MEQPLNFQEMLPLLQELPADIRREFLEHLSNNLIKELKKLIHINTKDVEKFLSISSGTVPHIKLRGTKVGKRVKPTLQDLEDYIQEHKAVFPAMAEKEYQETKKYIRDRIKQMKFLELDK